MKAHELRISNWINIGGNTIDTYQTYNPIKIDIHILNAIHFENEERPDAILSVFQPIPLTEEWMHKFGFGTADLEVDYFEWQIEGKESFCIVQDGMNGKHPFYFDYDLGDGRIRLIINYVHELQNLFYSLIKEELIIK